MSSLYWDNFEKRETETVEAIQNNILPPIRRVSIYATLRCNFACDYCKQQKGNTDIRKDIFDEIVSQYDKETIIHITGGEPSCVDWLYDYIDNSDKTFHLNSNGYIKPPKNIKRYKVSLDSCNEYYFDKLVHKEGAFNKVVENIKYATSYTVTSITCTLTGENYRNAPIFMDWCRKTFPNMYAVFFSVYKGSNERFIFTVEKSDDFFKNIVPELKKVMDKESLELFNETCNEKIRLIQSTRFPESIVGNTCYLSLSERIYDVNGNYYKCSHLFRDGICKSDSIIQEQCRYGCNRRLVKFNEDIEKIIKQGDCK